MEQSIQYFLTLFLSYLGLGIGSLISSFTKEELADGKKYFLISKPILFCITVFLFMNYIDLHLIISLTVSVLFFLLGFIWTKKFQNNLFFYSFFSIFLFETKSPNIAVLIFIFGIFSSSFYFKKKKTLLDNVIISLKRNIFYLFFGITLYFLF